jgi:hypothetical protein
MEQLSIVLFVSRPVFTLFITASSEGDVTRPMIRKHFSSGLMLALDSGYNTNNIHTELLSFWTFSIVRYSRVEISSF